MLTYALELIPDDNETLRVESPDFPELNSFGDDDSDALTHGRNALIAAIAGRILHKEDVPAPSAAPRLQRVALPALVAAKVGLYRAMRADRVTGLDLAKRLGRDPKHVHRLLDVLRASRMDHMEEALAALGKTVSIEVRDAA